MEQLIDYKALTAEQLEQCENSIVYFFEQMAHDGDELDKEACEEMKTNRQTRLDRIESSRLWLQDDGYIFIDL